jgi:hypothetical protein
MVDLKSPKPPPNGILILGAAKSGTTALFYAVQKALQNSGLSAKGLFEPRNQEKVIAYLEARTDAVPLVKALLGPFLRWPGDVSGLFAKRIIIYRDPRDNVVSRIPFMLTKLVALSEREKRGALEALFRRKERRPGTLSVIDMVREIEKISGRSNLLESIRNNALLPAKMKRERPNDFFLMPYDDLIEGKFRSLSDYIGFDVQGDYEVDQKHSFVIRTKASGGWKDWFLPEDIKYFAKEVADDYLLLGFNPNEAAKKVRSIAPKTCSEYVSAQFSRLDEKRKERRRDGRVVQSNLDKAKEKTGEGDQKAQREKDRRRRRRLRRASNPRQAAEVSALAKSAKPKKRKKKNR